VKKICIVGNDFKYKKLLQAYHFIFNYKTQRNFEFQIKEFLKVNNCYLTSCGTAGLYVILKSIKEKIPDKTEIIIPAYTPSVMILPAKKLNLKIKLCDISLTNFLIDISKIGNLITENTLAIIPVHLFGIPVDISKIYRILKDKINKEISIIEDFAQGFGSELNNIKLGGFSEIGFSSFGRGKNFSLYGGGLLVLNSDKYKKTIEKNLNALLDKSKISQIKDIIKFIFFSILIQPNIYFFLSNCISPFKSKKEQTSFSISKMGSICKKFGCYLFELWLQDYNVRIQNGMYLYNYLKNMDKLIVPEYPENAKIAFSRFPVIVKDIKLKYKLYYELKKNNIESSFMYNKPVHQIYDLGYKLNEFPNANYLAEHLLTLPVHGNINKKDLDKTISVLYDTSKKY